jgi:hypothetical protein
VALTGEREDAGLGEPAELLEDAAALGNADGEGHLLPARPRRGHRRRARVPQLGVVRARLRHPPPRPARRRSEGDGDGRDAVGKERKVGGWGSVAVASAQGVVQISNLSVGFTFHRGWRRAGEVPDPGLVRLTRGGPGCGEPLGRGCSRPIATSHFRWIPKKNKHQGLIWNF